MITSSLNKEMEKISNDIESDLSIELDEVVEEVFVELHQDDLSKEISEKTKIPAETVKIILATFVKHQLEVMKI